MHNHSPLSLMIPLGILQSRGKELNYLAMQDLVLINREKECCGITDIFGNL